MSSIFEKASYDGDTKLLESLKNTPEFSYERIINDASYDGNNVHVFDWLKYTGYVFNESDVRSAICNAVSIGQNHNLKLLEWFKNNLYHVEDIIFENFNVEDLNETIIKWILIYASTSGNIKLLEILKNSIYFSYLQIIYDASKYGHVHVFEWLKNTGYVFNEEEIKMAIENASNSYSFNILNWINSNNHNVQEIILKTDSPVKLISWTQSPEHKNLLDIVAYCARVSNPSNQMNTETNEKLALYLWKNEHFSPFEIISVCLEINTTRDIARQILRHRSFSFQEFSQRYAVADLGFTKKEARMQDKKNRQNSIETDDENLKLEWEKVQDEIINATKNAYEWGLKNGIAKEVARNVLCEGMTNSRLYMSGTLRSWLHYIKLRIGNGTQKEHKIIAKQCAKAIYPIFPLIKEFIGEENFN